MRRLAALMVGLGVLWGAPVAGATVSVSVSSDDVVQVAGDADANTINFTDGAHSTDGTDFGAEVFDPSGGPVTAGTGCFAADDFRNGRHVTAAYCGGSGASIVVDGADGNDTITYDVSSYLSADERPLTAITVDGGSGDDTLDFTLYNFVGLTPAVVGGDGNDKVLGGAGDLSVELGDGDDEFDGGSGGDIVHGGNGDDVILGGAGRDQLFGDAGNDTVQGQRDDDKVTGGPGNDNLSGDGDTAYTGNDEIFAVDGEKDTVSCDLGADTAHVDSIDAVEGGGQCEDVDVHAAGNGQTAKPGPSVGGASVMVAAPRSLRRGALVSHGAAVTVTSDQPLAGGVEIAVDGKTAKRLGLGRKTLVLGQKIGKVTGSTRFVVRPKAKYRSKLAHAKPFTLHVVVVLEDAASEQATKQYAVKVR